MAPLEPRPHFPRGLWLENQTGRARNTFVGPAFSCLRGGAELGHPHTTAHRVTASRPLLSTPGTAATLKSPNQRHTPREVQRAPVTEGSRPRGRFGASHLGFARLKEVTGQRSSYGCSGRSKAPTVLDRGRRHVSHSTKTTLKRQKRGRLTRSPLPAQTPAPGPAAHGAFSRPHSACCAPPPRRRASGRSARAVL